MEPKSRQEGMLNSPVLSLWLPWSYFSRLLRSCIGTVGLFLLPRPHRVTPAQIVGVERVKVLKVLGFKLQPDLKLNALIGETITRAESDLFALRLLKNHGLNARALEHILSSHSHQQSSLRVSSVERLLLSCRYVAPRCSGPEG